MPGKNKIQIRRARRDDLPAITEIYNEAIRTTTATFDTEPKSAADQEAWFQAHGAHFPLLVADRNHAVLGWTSLSAWSVRPAYSETAEVSVYVGEEHRGRGIGRALLRAILDAAGAAGFHTTLARIAEGNPGSVHLHRSLGFSEIGLMKEVGRKFGRRLDVLLMQKIDPQG